MNDDILIKLADYGAAVASIGVLYLIVKLIIKNRRDDKEEVLFLKMSSEFKNAIQELKEAIVELKGCIQLQNQSYREIARQLEEIKSKTEEIWRKEILS